MSRRSRILAPVLALGALAAAVLATAAPANADATVTSAGPLTTITTGDLLNCAVTHVGDTANEWFGTTACGTFVAVGNRLFGPQDIPAGGNATGSAGYTPYTQVSPATQTGTGTATDPFTITTTVALGDTGLSLTQVDTYQVGQESYRTSVRLSGAAADVVVFRGGDCYLQDSDTGLGQVQNGTAPICLARPDSSNPDRIEGMYPLTAGSAYLEDTYSTVWAAIATRQMLPNTCRCADQIDNGIALSWPVTVPASGTVSVDSLTVFSPVGAAPLTFSKTADVATVAAGGADGYTVTVSNPGVIPLTLQTITDTLPAGFSYVAGSSTGATTSNPTVTGQALTWTGPFPVPAATSAGNGTITLHFGVTVSDVAGTYTNSVTGVGRGLSVVGATDVAPVTVTAAPVRTVVLGKTADDARIGPGDQDGYTITASNAGTLPADLDSITDTLPAGFAYVAGSSTGATTSNPTVAGQVLTWAGPFTVPAATGSTPGTLTLHFSVSTPSVAGTSTNSVTAAGVGVTVVPAIDVAPITVVVTSPSPSPSTTPPTATATPSPSVTTSPSGSAAPPLADTGDDVRSPLLLAVVLLAGGVSILAVVRERRRPGKHT